MDSVVGVSRAVDEGGVYGTVEGLQHRHEGLVRWLVRRYGCSGCPWRDPPDLQQHLWLVLCDVYSRHAHRPSADVDRLVRTAFRNTLYRVWTQVAREREVLATIPSGSLLSPNVGRPQQVLTDLIRVEGFRVLSPTAQRIVRGCLHPGLDLVAVLERRQRVLSQWSVGVAVSQLSEWFEMSPREAHRAVTEIKLVWGPPP